MESLDDNMNMLRAWEVIKENVNILVKESLGYYELRQNKR
jgi:hypothetical protein